jgi:hypothetical protein
VNERELAEAMRKLAAENAAAPVPPEIEVRVMAAVEGRAPRRGVRWWIPMATVAMAASLAVAFWVTRHPAAAVRQAEAPFVAIPYVAGPAPYERTEVRRMDIPLAALIAAGVEVRATNVGGSVRADVLVGQDGRPLAIRLVRGSS